MNKTSTLDVGAILRLKNYIRKNKINLIHAHGTSFFLGCIQKMINPKLKLIWHDHYGKRIEKQNFNLPVLWMSSLFFNGIICVNNQLASWARKHLFTKKIQFLPNFVSVLPKQKELGFYTKEGFNIILLANLRKPKNHLNLLKAFRIVLNQKPECKLILVGKDFKDEYSEEIKLYIQEQTLQEHVRIAGVQTKLDSFLQTSQLGVLSSDSEGLPVSLLEYGLAGLPVVCTDVGDCRKVIGDFGKLVPIKNPEAMAKAILFYLNNNDMMNSDAKNFQKKTIENYSEKTVLPKFLKFYKEILSECGN